MNREKILELFRAARWYLEHKRASHQVGPLGGVVSITASTPETLQEEAESEEKSEFMTIVIELLSLAPITQAYRDYILRAVSVQYNFGLPADNVLSPIGFLDKGQWGLYEDQPDHERGWLEEGEASSFFLQTLGAMFVFLSEDTVEQMGLEWTAKTFVEHFIGAPVEENAWPKNNLFWGEIEKHLGHGVLGQWTRIFERADRILEWIIQFREHADEPKAFESVEPIFRRLAAYNPQMER